MSEGNMAAVAAMEWEDWLDPLEHALREGMHGYLRELLEAEVSAVLGRLRYGRQAGAKRTAMVTAGAKCAAPWDVCGSRFRWHGSWTRVGD